MKLTKQIEALEIQMREGVPESVIYPVLFRDEDGATLIDTGMAGQYEKLVHAVETAGLRMTDIKRIIITHQDMDHIGGLHDLLRQVQISDEVYAHPHDRGYIEGEKPLIKLSRERLSKSMPPEQLGGAVSKSASRQCGPSRC